MKDDCPKLISGEPTGQQDQIAVVTTYQGDMSFQIYASGFLDVASIALRNSMSIDATLPAVLYLVRHAAELFLKHVVLASQPDTLVPVSSELAEAISGHPLLPLWDRHKQAVTSHLEYEPRTHTEFNFRTWMTQFESILTEIDSVDSSGQTLRYPLDRKGSPNLGGTINISLSRVGLFIDYMTACFDAYLHRDC